jgi:hypothetical protein
MLIVPLIAAVFASSAAAASAPKVTLVDRAPVVLRGTSFKPYERIRLRTVMVGELTTRIVHATRTGSFRVSFTNVTLGACAAYSVRAIGDRGSRALLRLVPECAPGPTP